VTTVSLNVRQHVYALLYGEMKICGCGTPEDSFGTVRDLLIATEEHKNASTVISHDGARHIVLSVLDEVDLIEHGSVIDVPWLTKKGRWYLQAMKAMEYADLEDGEGDIGLPHEGAPCTERCLKPFWITP